jgi:hypothetical protein
VTEAGEHGRPGSGKVGPWKIGPEEEPVDKRTKDDYIGEIAVRSDDSEETKTIELSAHQFRINDAGDVDFASDAVREDIVNHVTAAALLLAHHELASTASE